MGLFRYFMSHLLRGSNPTIERFVQTLSETKPIRLLARFCARIIIERKAIGQDPLVKQLTPEKVMESGRKFSSEFVKTLKEFKEEVKKGLK